MTSISPSSLTCYISLSGPHQVSTTLLYRLLIESSSMISREGSQTRTRSLGGRSLSHTLSIGRTVTFPLNKFEADARPLGRAEAFLSTGAKRPAWRPAAQSSERMMESLPGPTATRGTIFARLVRRPPPGAADLPRTSCSWHSTGTIFARLLRQPTGDRSHVPATPGRQRCQSRWSASQKC